MASLVSHITACEYSVEAEQTCVTNDVVNLFQLKIHTQKTELFILDKIFQNYPVCLVKKCKIRLLISPIVYNKYYPNTRYNFIATAAHSVIKTVVSGTISYFAILSNTIWDSNVSFRYSMWYYHFFFRIVNHQKQFWKLPHCRD